MELFAALRFTEDENLTGRVYWYITPFPLKEGERVLAPVGPHDKLQCARVERTDSFSEAEAPYPPVLCKHVLAKLGDREIKKGVFDLGGVRYDDRHFTRLRRILIAREEGDGVGLSVKKIDTGSENWLQDAAQARECVLLFGKEIKEAAALILEIVRGDDPDEVPPSVLAALREKLC